MVVNKQTLFLTITKIYKNLKDFFCLSVCLPEATGNTDFFLKNFVTNNHLQTIYSNFYVQKIHQFGDSSNSCFLMTYVNGDISLKVPYHFAHYLINRE